MSYVTKSLLVWLQQTFIRWSKEDDSEKNKEWINDPHDKSLAQHGAISSDAGMPGQGFTACGDPATDDEI